MADREKRILIKEVIAPCNGCSGTGENVCDNCYDWDMWQSSPTRSEAIERMAKANWITVVCLKNKCTPESVSQKEWDVEWIKLSKQYKKVYFAGAEAALNALLEVEK